MEFLANKPWHKLVGWSLWTILWMHHEQHVGEACTKIGSICVVVSGGFRGVNIHALGAIKLHHSFSWDVWQTYDSQEINGQRVCLYSHKQRQLVQCEDQGKVRFTNRKHWLILTIDSGAIAKIPLLIFFQLRAKCFLEYHSQVLSRSM